MLHQILLLNSLITEDWHFFKKNFGVNSVLNAILISLISVQKVSNLAQRFLIKKMMKSDVSCRITTILKEIPVFTACVTSETQSWRKSTAGPPLLPNLERYVSCRIEEVVEITATQSFSFLANRAISFFALCFLHEGRETRLQWASSATEETGL